MSYVRTDPTSAATILDAIQEAVVLHAGDGTITGWNHAAENLYGVTRNDAIGRTLRSIFHGVGGHVAYPWAGDIERRLRDGRTLSLRVKMADLGGDRFLDAAIEIEPQKRLQREIKELQFRYGNIFQACSVAFLELDLRRVSEMIAQLREDGVIDLAEHLARNPEVVREMIRATKVLDLNPYSELVFGRGNRRELLEGIEPFWPEESFPVFAASLVAAENGASSFRSEVTLKTIDGQKRDVLFVVSFPFEMVQAGKVLIGIMDRSEDRRAQQALQSSERRYRNLFQTLPIAMLHLDRRSVIAELRDLYQSGVRDLRAYFREHPGYFDAVAERIIVIEANKMAAELFECASTQELHGPLIRLLQEARGAMESSMVNRFAGEQLFSEEITIRTSKGNVRHAIYVAYFPEGAGSEEAGVSCLIDVTDRVNAEAALAQLQSNFRHAARVSMLGELTASIAHEINQPLGAILTNGQAGLRWLNRAEPDLEELRALSERTVADARRAADIISRIRDMASRRAIELAPININKTIEEVFVFLDAELRRKQVDVTLRFDPDLPLVHADRIQFQQVISNLVVNAAQAMDHIDQRRALFLRTYVGSNATVMIEIEDTGPGFDPEIVKHVFDSFFTTKESGLGIGLSICRSIMDAHHGTISAANRQEERGAIFRLTLPTARSDAGR